MTDYNKEKNNTDEFSFKTIENFDEHINISIPNYSFLANHCRQYSDYFIRERTNVVDLGCSSGKFLNSLNHIPSVGYYGYDVAENLFLEPASSNVHFEAKDLVELTDNTLHHGPPSDSFVDDISFAISLFTLQFLPPIKRHDTIRAISEKMVKGGAFISCEKIYSGNSKLQDITNSIYYEFKSKSFTGDQILSKEQDLRKIMTPQTLSQSMKQLECIGQPNVFFMSYNFVGLIAIKE